MVKAAEALFHVSSRLCVAAAAVLAGALLGAQLQRRAHWRARGGSRRPAPSANHWRLLTAHIFTLLCVESARSLYLFQAMHCQQAVPVQNFLELSGHFWLHALCFNIIISFRNNRRARNDCATLLLSLVYACFCPTIILLAVDHSIHGQWLIFQDILYDTKTCFLDTEYAFYSKENDVSLQLAITRGVSILVSSVLFIYMSIIIGFKKRTVVLCPEDAQSISDVSSRQNQALKYILTIGTSQAMEIVCDVSAWYCTFHYTRSFIVSPATEPSESSITFKESLLLGQWLSKSISFCVDFLRVLVLCEVLCWGGPAKKTLGGGGGEGPPPPYEVAAHMPRLHAPASPTAPHLPPPSYASIFGERRNAEDTAVLLTPPPSPPTPPTPPAASAASILDVLKLPSTAV